MPKKPATEDRTRAIVEEALMDYPAGPLTARLAPYVNASEAALLAHAAASPFRGKKPVLTEDGYLDIAYDLYKKAQRQVAKGKGEVEMAWCVEAQRLTSVLGSYQALGMETDWTGIVHRLAYLAVGASGVLIGREYPPYDPIEAMADAEALRTTLALVTPDEVVELLAYDKVAKNELRLAVMASLGAVEETRTPHR